MTQAILSPPPSEETLDTPANATRTSDYEIRDEARDVYAAAVLESLDKVDDMVIALQVRARGELKERTELTEFIREQGYDPADFGI